MIRRIIATTAAAALVAAATGVSAAPRAPRAPDPAIPRHTGGAYPAYPPDADATGQQGKVVVEGTVRADGTLVDPRIVTGSHSPLLDEAALKAFSAWRFEPGKDSEGKPVDRLFRTTLDFSRDTVGGPRSFVRKSCADLIIDVGWFNQTYPGEPLKQMQLYSLTLGLFTVLVVQNESTVKNMITMVRGMPQAFDETVAECRAHPEAPYFSIIRAKAERLAGGDLTPSETQAK